MNPFSRRIACAPALALVAALGLVPGAVPIAHAASEPAPSPDDDAELTEAQQLHRQGLAAFETYDYPSAITAWTRAYERVEGHPRANEIRIGLVYNIAAARIAQFRLDGDLTQLQLAKQLLLRYREAVIEAERVEVEAKIAELDALLTEAGAPPEPPTTEAEEPAVAPETPVDDSAAPERVRRPGRGLVVGGSVTLAGGLGLLGGMAAGLAAGNSADAALRDPTRPATDLQSLQDDGRRANGMAIGCGIAAGVLVGTGIALIVIGARRHGGHGKATARWTGEGLSWRF